MKKLILGAILGLCGLQLEAAYGWSNYNYGTTGQLPSDVLAAVRFLGFSPEALASGQLTIEYLDSQYDNLLARLNPKQSVADSYNIITRYIRQRGPVRNGGYQQQQSNVPSYSPVQQNWRGQALPVPEAAARVLGISPALLGSGNVTLADLDRQYRDQATQYRRKYQEMHGKVLSDQELRNEPYIEVLGNAYLEVKRYIQSSR